MSLGKFIDQLFKLDQEIAKVEATKAAVVKKRTTLEEQLLKKFKQNDLQGGVGQLGMLTVKKSNFPSIEDPEKFYAYVLKKKALDLLQRRVNITAFRDRLESGVQVPGIKVFTKIALRVTKRKR